jgi:hypothetical protein
MATDVLSLFNMPTQEQLGRSYLEGMLTSPQQMGAQSLLQQVVSLGGNAGAGLGYGIGRLMGGMTADEVRAKGINDAMQAVQSMGLTSDAEMYGALSQELARRGLTQDALLARNTALKAAQTEQGMKTEAERSRIAGEQLRIAQAQEQRAVEETPLKIEKLKLDITKSQEDLKTTEEQLAEALKEGKTARAEGLQRRLDVYKNEIEFKKRELDIRSRQADASMLSANAAASRAEAMGNQESFSQNVTVRDLMNNPVSIGRYSTKLNEFMANDGTRFKTRSELEAYVKQQSPASTVVTPKGGTANWQSFLPPQQPKQ